MSDLEQPTVYVPTMTVFVFFPSPHVLDSVFLGVAGRIRHPVKQFWHLEKFLEQFLKQFWATFDRILYLKQIKGGQLQRVTL